MTRVWVRQKLCAEWSGVENRESAKEKFTACMDRTTVCPHGYGISTLKVGKGDDELGSYSSVHLWSPSNHGAWPNSVFSSVTQTCLTLCDSMDYSTPGFPVHHQLPELAHTPVHRDSDAIQQSHSLSSPSPAFYLPQHRGLFQCVSSSHQVTQVLEFQLQHQSYQ